MQSTRQERNPGSRLAFLHPSWSLADASSPAGAGFSRSGSSLGRDATKRHDQLRADEALENGVTYKVIASCSSSCLVLAQHRTTLFTLHYHSAAPAPQRPTDPHTHQAACSTDPRCTSSAAWPAARARALAPLRRARRGLPRPPARTRRPSTAAEPRAARGAAAAAACSSCDTAK